MIRTTPVPCVICGSSTFNVTAEGIDYQYRTTRQTFRFVRCLTCGHEYLNPRPATDDIEKAYPANYYTLEGRHTKRASRIISFMKHHVVTRRLSYFQKLFSGPVSVLEIGCGDASLLMALKQANPSLEVSGIDFTIHPDTEQECRNLDIHLINGNVEQTDLPENSYDLVIMNQLIEHLTDPVQCLQSINRSLKPGGFISIETPNANGCDRRFFSNSFWGGYYFPRHLHLFDKQGLTSLLESTGFSVVSHQWLVAPIIWAFSCHAWFFYAGKDSALSRLLERFFSDRNPLCLGIFTVVDLVCRAVGCETSNQKVIGIKRGI